MTAKTCAERGLSVLLLEKDAEIGAPKRCAEGISMRGFERAGLEYNRRYIAQEIDGAVLWSPSGKSVVMQSEESRGYVLERKVFEKYLARDAIMAGAKVMMKASAVGLLKRDGEVGGVVVESMGEQEEVKAKIVIGADGVESKIGRMAGIKTLNVLKDYISGFQYEMAGVSNLDMRKIHLWFGNNIAPKGYLWVFPKGDEISNVGIGIPGTENEKKRAREYLDEFISEHPEFFANASPIEVNSGGVPVSGYIKESFVSDGLMLVGDAAQMVNPIHGGGMSTNLYAAQICGRVAAEAIGEGDTSKERLMQYEREWRETDGKRMEKLLKLRYFLENLSDEDFEYFADVLSGEDINNMQKGKTKFLLKMLVKKPKLLLYAKRFLSG